MREKKTVKKLFYSYSHEDENFRDEIAKHLIFIPDYSRKVAAYHKARNFPYFA